MVFSLTINLTHLNLKMFASLNFGMEGLIRIKVESVDWYEVVGLNHKFYFDAFENYAKYFMIRPNIMDRFQWRLEPCQRLVYI